MHPARTPHSLTAMQLEFLQESSSPVLLEPEPWASTSKPAAATTRIQCRNDTLCKNQAAASANKNLSTEHKMNITSYELLQQVGAIFAPHEQANPPQPTAHQIVMHHLPDGRCYLTLDDLTITPATFCLEHLSLLQTPHNQCQDGAGRST